MAFPHCLCLIKFPMFDTSEKAVVLLNYLETNPCPLFLPLKALLFSLSPFLLQAKFTKASEFQDRIRIVTPDWITDSAAERKRLPEDDYSLIPRTEPPNEQVSEPSSLPQNTLEAEEKREGKSEQPLDVSETMPSIEGPKDASMKAGSRKQERLSEVFLMSVPTGTTPSASQATPDGSLPLVDPRFAFTEDVPAEPRKNLRSARIVHATPIKAPSPPTTASAGFRDEKDGSAVELLPPPPALRRTRSQSRDRAVQERHGTAVVTEENAKGGSSQAVEESSPGQGQGRHG